MLFANKNNNIYHVKRGHIHRPDVSITADICEHRVVDNEGTDGHIFCHLNIILIVFGLNVCHSPGYCRRVLLYLPRLATITYQLYCITFGFLDLTSRPSELYYYMALEFKLLIVFITYLVVVRMCAKIYRFQTVIWVRLDAAEKRNVRSMSRCLKYIWLAAMIVCPIGHLCYESQMIAVIRGQYGGEHQVNGTYIKVNGTEFMPNNMPVGWWPTMIMMLTETGKWTVWSTYNLGWLVASVSIYAYIVFGYYRLEQQMEAKLEKARVLDATDIVWYRRKYCDFQIFREHFNRQFGSLPFLWYGELFTATCFRITQFALVERADYRYFITYLFEYVLWMLVQVGLALFLGHLSSRRRTQLEIMQLIGNKLHPPTITPATTATPPPVYGHSPGPSVANETIGELIVFNQILMASGRRRNWFEAWSVFVLDRKLVFQFLAAVIPFSVMLIQLSKERKYYVG